MTVADNPTASLIDPPKAGAVAVSYLRVSTREQAEKGGTDEGFSIPAQREATRRKAEQLGAGIVEEFIDAGASAKSSDRPELMRMIQYVKANKVSYCIVHKVDRLARNRADDVSIRLALQQCASCSSPRRRTSTRHPPGCCCTASCPRSPSSTPATSPPRSPKA